MQRPDEINILDTKPLFLGESAMQFAFSFRPMLVALISLTIIVGCAPVIKNVGDYEILADTSGLELDDSQKPTLVFLRPDAPTFAAYDRFIVDTVQVNYADPKMKEISPERVGEMQQYLRDAIIRELRAGGFTVGTRTEPKTLRISITISDLRAPSAAANVTAAVVPIAWSVGQVTVEAVFREAVTDRIDAVVVERSQGSRGLNPTPWSTWADVTATFDRWAKGIRQAAEEAHGR